MEENKDGKVELDDAEKQGIISLIVSAVTLILRKIFFRK